MHHKGSQNMTRHNPDSQWAVPVQSIYRSNIQTKDPMQFSWPCWVHRLLRFSTKSGAKKGQIAVCCSMPSSCSIVAVFCKTKHWQRRGDWLGNHSHSLEELITITWIRHTAITDSPFFEFFFHVPGEGNSLWGSVARRKKRRPASNRECLTVVQSDSRSNEG